MKIKISYENTILIKILFLEKNLNESYFKNLDFERFVKISSSQLMLPALFVNLKKKKYLKFIPEDLSIYLKEIYQINSNKNIVLLEEIKILEKELGGNYIPFLFIKGAANIKSELYFDNGERMLGDIDFLISEKNSNKCGEILTKNLNYKFSKIQTKYWKKRHLPRLTGKDKIHAVEVHTNITDYKLLNFNFNDDFIKFQDDLKIMAKITILNFQLNDYGHFKAIYSLKSIYDVVQIMKKQRISISENKYTKRFFLISNLLGITKLKINENWLDRIYMKRFILKNNYKFISVIDNFICDIIIITKKRILQLIEFLFNNEYRLYLIKKI
mgnify:CR=1 FL=1|tara:strand:+ start:39 stop:1022 length:984 start_codon:yes stop_codon:yes gene_type:complete